MKCKYCGVEIGNNLECHLCGHKQIGKTRCPVCSKIIYPYQEYCSSCGSPTIYRKSEPIKKVTPDTIIHSETSHNYNTVSESYDYKKNAYDFKDSMKQLKNLNTKINKSHKHFIKRIVMIIILVCFLFIPIAEIVIGYVMDNVNTEDGISYNKDDIGNVGLEDLSIQQDTSTRDYNYNFNNHSGGAFVFQNKLYVSLDNHFVRYNQSFDEEEFLEDESCDDIYVDERGCFYRLYDEFIFMDHQGEKTSLLEDIDRCYVDQQNIFYLKDDQLYCLTLDENMKSLSNQKIVSQVNDYYVDSTNQRILYTDNDYQNQLVDYKGNILKKNMNTYSDCFFDQGLLYYREYDGIYSVNLDTNEQKKIKELDDIYRFGLGNDEDIIYVENFDNSLDVYAGDDTYHLCDEARDFFIIGDKVVYYVYDEDYTRHYFIGNARGEYALLEEE